MKVLPLFKSHYSLGRSILTLETPDSCVEDGPNSVINLATKNGIDKVFLVEENMSSFLQAYTNCKAAKLHLVYGVRMMICPDIEEKTEDSLGKSCKYIIFAKNTDGYKNLINIYSLAAKQGFYYQPRIDFKTLAQHWNNDNLLLAIPFYDSFIHKNSLSYSLCVPEMGFTEPVFFVEDNGLPFDDIIQEKVENYSKGKHEILKAKSIYYEFRNDFSTYLTCRCINNRSLLSSPQINHMCSEEFCFESWKEQDGR